MKRDRRVGQHLLRQRLAADALLQQGERRDRARPSRRRSRRRARCRRAAPRSGRDDLGKALGDQLLAARPDPDLRRRACTTCARMPSYFHSTIQSAGAAEPRRRTRRAAASSGCARKNGYGWPPSSGPALGAGASAQVALRRSARRGRRCSPSCAARPAWRRRRAPSASARCTSSLLTPTRKPPPISLLSRKRPARVELVPVRRDARRLLLGRQAAQRQQALLDPLGQAEVALAAPAAAARARWSRRGRRPPGSSRRTASRRCRRASHAIAAQHARSARPGAACRRPGSRPPRRRRAARRGGEVALAAHRPCRAVGGARVELGEERGEAPSLRAVALPSLAIAAVRDRPRRRRRRTRSRRPAPRRPCSPSQRTITAS